MCANAWHAVNISINIHATKGMTEYISMKFLKWKYPKVALRHTFQFALSATVKITGFLHSLYSSNVKYCICLI